MPAESLSGRRILVVEDELLIALEIVDVLERLGCVAVGPTAELEAALELARDQPLDAAILDVTIQGGQVYPVAEQLLARGVPFVLASGYGNWVLPKSLRNSRRLTKPFSRDELEKSLRSLCDAGP